MIMFINAAVRRILLGVSPKVIFGLSLDGTIVPEKVTGSGVATFSRATTATVADFEGLIKTVKSGEARFWGYRRVENLLTGSETLATQSPTVTAGTHVFSMGICSGSVTFSGAATGTLAGDNTNRRAITLTTTAGTLTITVTGSVTKAQLERVTGQSNQNPSEYVSVGVLSAPYHGANVDGVKYFNYLNANTVASNIVTEARDGPIALTTRLGYLSEGQRANLCLQSDDLSNASWTKTNCTAAKTAIGADGIANSASTLTATAGNATCLQAITRVSAARITGCYIKRRTGTGTINLTQDNGTTWTAVTVTSSWTRVLISSTTSANPTVGLQIVTNGDAVDVQYFQHEEGPNLSSPISTTTVSVTRNADVLSYSSQSNVFGDHGTVYAELSMPLVPAGFTTTGSMVFLGLANASTPSLMMLQTANTTSSICIRDGTFNSQKTGLTELATGARKRACRWSSLGLYSSGDGVSPARTNFDGDMGLTGTLYVGPTGAPCYGTIRNVKIWDKPLKDGQFLSLTA